MAASIYYAIQQAVQTRIQGSAVCTGTPGIATGNVILLQALTTLKRDVRAAGAAFPCLLLAPFGNELADPKAGTNFQDDIVYPVAAVMVDANQQDNLQEDRLTSDTYDLWQEETRGLFHNKRLAGATTVYAGFVEPLANPDVQSWMVESVYVWGLVLRFRSRENRSSS